MKKMLSALLSAAAVCLFAAEVPVNFKAALAKTKADAGAVKGWYRNGSSRKGIGVGKVVKEKDTACFQIKTDKLATEFYGMPYVKVQAGQTVEFEITAQGTGQLLTSCYAYDARKKFFYPGNLLKRIPLVKDKKVYKSSIKLLDGRKGEKLGYILLVVGAGVKSDVTIYDVKARVTDAK